MGILVGSFFTLGILACAVLVIVLLINNKNNNSAQSNQGYRKLTRSLNNRYISGVCGGIGEYFRWDPTLVRLIFLLLGAGAALPYIILAIVLPLSKETL